MGIEIERKFLVGGDQWRRDATTCSEIRQAYLSSGERSSIRIRIKDGNTATLTVKSQRAELRRIEVECPIALPDAEALLTLRESSLLHKVRYRVPSGKHVWEVDVFRGDNAGLVIAEIELSDAGEHFDRPTWLGMEVTGQRRYYNSALARHPYCQWPAPMPIPAGEPAWAPPAAAKAPRAP